MALLPMEEKPKGEKMMKRTVKEYQANLLVSSPLNEAETFGKNLQDAIVGCQERGLIVEVQFQSDHSRFSALVLGFKNVVKEWEDDTVL